MTPNNARDKLKMFRAFNKGWRYGEGEAFNQTAIDELIRLNAFAGSMGIYESDAFPGARGEIILTLYIDDWCLEITREANGEFTVILEEGEREIKAEENLSTSEVETRIKHLPHYERNGT